MSKLTVASWPSSRLHFERLDYWCPSVFFYLSAYFIWFFKNGLVDYTPSIYRVHVACLVYRHCVSCASICRPCVCQKCFLVFFCNLKKLELILIIFGTLHSEDPGFWKQDHFAPRLMFTLFTLQFITVTDTMQFHASVLLVNCPLPKPYFYQ